MLPNDFKPMLAAAVTLEMLDTLPYPLLVSPKLDGVRCIVAEGIAYSRKMKPFRNEYLQSVIKKLKLPDGLDGELIVGESNAPDVFVKTTSAVMSYEGSPDFTFHVFDTADVHLKDKFFLKRLEYVRSVVRRKAHLVVVPHEVVTNVTTLRYQENKAVDDNYEGVMLRRPDGPYKHGRSTLREAWLLKLKRFQDAEAVVCAIEAARENVNTAHYNALGYTERSRAAAGLRTKPSVGALLCRDTKTGAALRISPGKLTAKQREYYYKNQSEIVGKLITYQYTNYGKVDLPRFPVFHRFRNELV